MSSNISPETFAKYERIVKSLQELLAQQIDDDKILGPYMNAMFSKIVKDVLEKKQKGYPENSYGEEMLAKIKADPRMKHFKIRELKHDFALGVIFAKAKDIVEQILSGRCTNCKVREAKVVTGCTHAAQLCFSCLESKTGCGQLECNWDLLSCQLIK